MGYTGEKNIKIPSGSSHPEETGDGPDREGEHEEAQRGLCPRNKWSRLWEPGMQGARGLVVRGGLFGKVASEQRTEGSEGADPMETGDRASPAEGRAGPVRTCLMGVVGPVHQEVMRLQRACEGRGGRQVRREQRPGHRREAM